MKNLIFITAFYFYFFNFVNAETIASCSGLKGKSYYPFFGAVTTKSNAGWHDDGISNGKVSVIRDGTNFDVLYVDALGGINSAKNSGAQIDLKFIGESSFSISAWWPQGSLEIYSFWRNDRGKNKYSLNQVKGEGNKIPKYSLFVGDCSSIDLAWIEEIFKEEK